MEDTLPFNDAISADDAPGAIGSNVANVANGINFTIVAIGTIIVIGVIVNIAIIVLPMYHYWMQWIVIVPIGANVATVAIGHQWYHQLSLDILIFIWPRNGANGAI